MGGGGSPAGDFSCAGVSPAFSIESGHLHLVTEVDNAADVFMLDGWLILIKTPRVGFSTTGPSDELASCDAEVLKGSNLLSLTDENLEGKQGRRCEYERRAKLRRQHL